MQGDEVTEKTVSSDAWKLFFEVFVDSLNSVASEGEKLITCQAFSKVLVPHSCCLHGHRVPESVGSM